MIHLAIVDDDDKSRKNLSEYATRFSKESGEKISIFTFTDGAEIAEEYKAEFDIIFLDIQMKFMDGMKAAQIIRQFDSEVILIFITNLAQYALKGYEVNAMNFLIKPMTYFAFAQELHKAIKTVKDKKQAYFFIKTESGILRLSVDEILYIESIKHQIIVHTKTQSYATRDTMKNVEAMLSKYHFVRCNNCYLVNLRYVEGVIANEVMIHSEQLAISRPRKKEFLDHLADYVGGSL